MHVLTYVDDLMPQMFGDKKTFVSPVLSVLCCGSSQAYVSVLTLWI